MDQQTEYLSQEKYDQLMAELENLKKVERKNVAEQLEYAKSLGDLSENAEYHEARDKQADIEDRIKELQTILQSAVIIGKQKNKTGDVNVGSEVTVKKVGGSEVTYTIVGSEEANMAEGKISYQSPLGSALMNQKKDTKIMVSTPKGEIEYAIIEVK
ncbi:MAG: transcription elongation factor GreA [Patescibacteria group bacterium]|nr:transcription elongation factor GreA [Patescibacteria group bacterium]